MSFFKRKRRGETLIEVIVAIGVLGLGAITASSLIISSIRNTSVNKNYLVANNLAREGIEAIRSIRDTNWLRFSYDTENCWHVVDDDEVINNGGDCKPVTATKMNNTSSTKFYRVNINGIADAKAPFKFKLTAPQTAGEFVPSIDPNAREFYLLEPDQSNLNLYRHTDNPEGVVSNGTSFYRAIAISNESPDTGKVTHLRVAAIVQWLEQGDLKELVLDTVLTNHQQ